jgi:hypothetical protein
MNCKHKWTITKFLPGFFIIAIIIFIGVTIIQAAEVTLIGEINDEYRLVADGEIYDIAETPVGDDLARNYISMKVKVTGTVQEGPELKILTVRTFEVVDE